MRPAAKKGTVAAGGIFKRTLPNQYICAHKGLSLIDSVYERAEPRCQEKKTSNYA